MRTVTFCQEVEVTVTDEQLDAHVDELKRVSMLPDAYWKSIGGRRYLYSVYPSFDEPLDQALSDPERAEPAASSAVMPPPLVGAAPPHGSSANRPPPSAAQGLIPLDFHAASETLGCDAAAIRAVAEIESGGRSGFLPDGRPKILFESHVFSRLTGGRYDQTHPDLSTRKWTRNYVGGAGEHERLARARQLDREAADQAASWGKFQILGRNHKSAGHETVAAFVEAQCASEQAQLHAFVQFIINNDLCDELRDRDWASFARKYNGPGYAENRYDIKMAQAYERYLGA